jgi:hypothetical protein
MPDHSGVETGPLYSGSPAKQSWPAMIGKFIKSDDKGTSKGGGGEDKESWFMKEHGGKSVSAEETKDPFAGRSKAQQAAIKADPRYGKLSEQDLDIEMKRQSKHHAATGKWDAMGVYDAEGKRKPMEKLQVVKPWEKKQEEPEPTLATVEMPTKTETETKEKKGNWFKRAGKWLNKKAEDLADFRASEEGAAFKDTMHHFANITDRWGGGRGDFSTDNQAKFQQSKRADEASVRAEEAHTRSQEAHEAQLKSRNVIDKINLAKLGEQTTDETTLASVDEQGNPVMDKYITKEGTYDYKNDPKYAHLFKEEG